MATLNPFDLLEDDDTEDPSLLIAAQQKKIRPKKPNVPSKPLPLPKLSEAKTESDRGGGSSVRGRGYGRGRGAGSGFNRDSTNNSNSPGKKAISGFQGATDEADSRTSSVRRGGYGGPRGLFRGGHRGGFSNGVDDEGKRYRPRRAFDRHSGTGRGYADFVVFWLIFSVLFLCGSFTLISNTTLFFARGEMKREGSGRGNWEWLRFEKAPNEGEKILDAEKPSERRMLQLMETRKMPRMKLRRRNLRTSLSASTSS